MKFPDTLRYTKEHEWVKVDGTTGTVGITDFAQSELGDVVYVELPSPGAKLEQGKSFGTIEAVKAVSDLYAPVSGEVVEINKELSVKPELVNQQPYDAGWMVKVKISKAAELGELLDAAKYQELIGQS
ncbi:MAG TPA: glycine cleavage system protein GcvH [Bacteroidota bacterium]